MEGMTVAEWCVFGAVLLYLLTIAPSRRSALANSTIPSRAIPLFTTIDPLRALGAHLNGIETFPFFAALCCLPSSAPRRKLDQRIGGVVPDRPRCLCLHLSRQPPDVAHHPLEHRVCHHTAIFFLPFIRLYLPG